MLTCICPRSCDCQNPEGDDVAHISNECPVHNLNPWPNPECQAEEHRGEEGPLMTPEEFNALPALSRCPGKPACDADAPCSDHRDVFRYGQRIEEFWRSTVIAARGARDTAEEYGRTAERERCAKSLQTESAERLAALKEIVDRFGHHPFCDTEDATIKTKPCNCYIKIAVNAIGKE